MMWVLILVLMTKLGPGTVSSSSIEFSEQMNCLQAVGKLMDWEQGNLKIKAMCVKK